MLVKTIIVVIFLGILYSLGSGLYFLLKDEKGEGRTVQALTWRIGLSIALFVLILIGIATGVIQPHGLYPTR
ncbi:twin transmembrane helix small protein [Candidatus Macondimonas diazotrophica]|uniref:Twin transmembrane helix small protein n=1 Tax=Candidatus Macondimonas diazotrophica TaxID=2305248 RepID=A0A4Z0FDW6_9GAMM|nr:twin transmembrane helix small protein [Candidatus Macondimonas diazotrophica]MDY6955892.1 twin transmembrane helix small protein [Pseudomonadota bacterium]TFZ83728.1 twin transmembrane helix small protein [Candidatus Macondimonas diazotrophica]HBG50968.1 twin transmembrane helix small protein [Gammaproteobacteria bacterium]